MSGFKYHVGLGPGDVGSYVLTPGDPFRTERIATHLDSAREVAFSREFRTFTGSLRGQPVSTVSSGIGGPSAAIMVEELADLGVHTFLRVGTCGGGQPGIHQGDLVIATASVRSEGTPDGYVPREYPAVADHALVEACIAACVAAGAPHHVGIIRSVDALYSDLLPERLPRGPELRAELEMWQRAGILANDMESATVMVVAATRGLRAGSILLCVDELGAGEIVPGPREHMDRMLAVATDALGRLIELDGAAARQ